MKEISSLTPSTHWCLTGSAALYYVSCLRGKDPSWTPHDFDILVTKKDEDEFVAAVTLKWGKCTIKEDGRYIFMVQDTILDVLSVDEKLEAVYDKFDLDGVRMGIHSWGTQLIPHFGSSVASSIEKIIDAKKLTMYNRDHKCKRESSFLGEMRRELYTSRGFDVTMNVTEGSFCPYCRTVIPGRTDLDCPVSCISKKNPVYKGEQVGDLKEKYPQTLIYHDTLERDVHDNYFRDTRTNKRYDDEYSCLCGCSNTHVYDNNRFEPNYKYKYCKTHSQQRAHLMCLRELSKLQVEWMRQIEALHKKYKATSTCIEKHYEDDDYTGYDRVVVREHYTY